MTYSALATRYASALVDVLTSTDAPITAEIALEQLRAFAAMMRESAPLRNALESPAVSLPRKRAVIDRFAKELGLARAARNFLLVLLDKRRIASLSEILDAAESQLDEHRGFVRADLRSAQPMDEQQQQSLAQDLGRIAGKQVRLRFQVDPDLIGGVVARLGSTVYDGSVRGRLAQIAKRLSA
jgi:F-type H+-transporting ATPase subunit delta